MKVCNYYIYFHAFKYMKRFIQKYIHHYWPTASSRGEIVSCWKGSWRLVSRLSSKYTFLPLSLSLSTEFQHINLRPGNPVNPKKLPRNQILRNFLQDPNACLAKTQKPFNTNVYSNITNRLHLHLHTHSHRARSICSFHCLAW